MNEQAIVDRFAELAKPRLSELLRLNIEHIYDPTSGDAKSIYRGVAGVGLPEAEANGSALWRHRAVRSRRQSNGLRRQPWVTPDREGNFVGHQGTTAAGYSEDSG